jgi:AcrR family transcriptional regulator
MPSQKSTVATALAPKRERGRVRVAAILDAAAAVFAEKGYDGATMTEIAARADTAIGSLYRFFPTKEVLAEALLARFGERVMATLDALAARAAALAPAALAEALVDLKFGLRPDRAAAFVLVDASGDGMNRRLLLREVMRQRLAAILMAATGSLPRAKAEAMAVLLQHVLKIVPVLTEEPAAARAVLLAETRDLIRLYLEHAFAIAASRPET